MRPHFGWDLRSVGGAFSLQTPCEMLGRSWLGPHSTCWCVRWLHCGVIGVALCVVAHGISPSALQVPCSFACLFMSGLTHGLLLLGGASLCGVNLRTVSLWELPWTLATSFVAVVLAPVEVQQVFLCFSVSSLFILQFVLHDLLIFRKWCSQYCHKAWKGKPGQHFKTGY